MGWDEMGWDGMGRDGMGWDEKIMLVKCTLFFSSTKEASKLRFSSSNLAC